MAETAHLPRASAQTGEHPRPQLLRERWTDLDGTWQLGLVPAGAPSPRGLWRGSDLTQRAGFERDVVVPYPPESAASGVGEQGPFAELWYRRGLRLRDVAGAEALGEGARLVLRFGAVDHGARVWFDGQLVAEHTGGQTPFSADVTELLDADQLDLDLEHVLVVRAVDDARDPELPRGKQDWHDAPHAIWYRRTSGIWQTVWAEVVPAVSIEHLTWTTDLTGATVHLVAELSSTPVEPASLAVRLSLGADGDERVLAEAVVAVPGPAERGGPRVEVALAVPLLRHGQEREALLWSPEHPHLVDAQVRLLAGSPSSPGDELDAVASYLGMRSVGVGAGRLMLNGTPRTLRSVLDQGWWPDTHLAASAERLRTEAQLLADLGFDSVRIHQKVEDPRFLHWCDRLGITVWAETANAYAHTARAVSLLTAEWLEVVRRDASHPSVVAWVPLNESWGVQDVAACAGERAYATALAALTRALDPTRPVISNDGWEHTDSDVWTVHDYTDSGQVLLSRYGSPEAAAALVGVPSPSSPSARVTANGRRLRVAGGARGGDLPDEERPLVLSEFGGVRFTPGSSAPEGATWGYSTAWDADDFARRLGDLLGAANACVEAGGLVGWCYTQLADTLQEANGLVTEDRTPKLPLAQLRGLVTGELTGELTGERG
ncbi:glycoside hydrolase family 2 [Streptomyces sp. NP160]|uniref:glycoside hydrolase family 2 protein n=1 Tax=Streptomyces sp. NP160 TaxID=2586637 RepID=UPI001119DBE7|nr:glycoside hydrolase family 2 TIM barrel-domain containing protein [Streptomyces sp. NP160]TNM60687.1 glycoside hydrolase family 2 [Streptomyces sp. NP160]